MDEYYNSKTHTMLQTIESKIYSSKHHPISNDLKQLNSSQQINSKMTLSRYIDNSSSNIQTIKQKLRSMTHKQKHNITENNFESPNQQLQRKLSKLETQNSKLKTNIQALQDQLSKQKCSTDLQIKVKLQDEEISYLNRCNKIQNQEILKLRRIINRLHKQTNHHSSSRLSDCRCSTPNKTISKLNNIEIDGLRISTEGSTRSKRKQDFVKGKNGSMYLKRNGY